MNYLLVGTADFTEFRLVRQFVRNLPVGDVIVGTGMPGVEATAADEAVFNGRNTKTHLPDYYRDGKKFAPVVARITAICDADVLVIFEGQKKNSVACWRDLARQYRKTVQIIQPSTPQDTMDRC